jgi:DMSO/TMAO reductase YedYZ molybdopterin-dependent catalytic subunit
MTGMTTRSATGTGRRRPDWARLGVGALFGVLSAAAALGVGELVAAATGAATAPELVVGTAMINLAPPAVKDFAIREFGTNDKVVLVGGVLIVLALLAVVAGVIAMRRPRWGIAIVLTFGAVGIAAAATAPAASFAGVLPSLCAGLAGALALALLLRAHNRSTADIPADVPVRTRRDVLVATGAVTAVAAVAGVTGRLLQSGSDSAAVSRAAVRLPRPADPAPALPQGYRFRLPGLTPFTTPNEKFYRVDTALALPQVTTDQWALSVHGMVDHPLRLSYADILTMPLVERDLTLSCVSNEVGGPYVSTARWLGVPLATLLRKAGVRAGAQQLVSRSVDGMTIGSPTEIVLDGRDALLAVAMNGEPLPIEHGFPARLIVPGLFGYASATKWVVDLAPTTYATRPYWVRRGYDRLGMAKTGSRIDLPRPFAQLKPGPVTVAGIAFAQHRGISAVQVRVDGGPWRDAELTTQVSYDTWRQWRYTWQATTSGPHQLEVRAADARGELQPGNRTPVFPSGATGWESVVVTVTT